MPRVVLIVDDDETERVLRAKLQEHHHHLAVTHADAVHLDALRDFAPQVILLDTGENGGSVYVRHRLLSDPQLSQVPCVVLAKTPAEARALGAQAFFTRPFNADALVAVIETLAQLSVEPMPV